MIREFLLNFGPVIMLILALTNLFTLDYFGRSWARYRKFITLCFLIVCLGLFYDSFILALGSAYTGQGLVVLSKFRYILHGAMIPFLFSVCCFSVTENKKARTFFLCFTGVCSVIGVVAGALTQLELSNVANITRYATASSTPAFSTGWTNALSYCTVIPLIICGIIVWVKKKTPAIFLGGALMFFFAAIGPSTGNSDLIFMITMFGEECMVGFFVLYNRWLTTGYHFVNQVKRAEQKGKFIDGSNQAAEPESKKAESTAKNE